MKGPVSLRPASLDDEAFLRRMFAAARPAEFAHISGGPVQQESILRVQFDAQRLHYRQHFPEAIDQIIQCGGHPIGRLYVSRRKDEIRVLDIAVLHEHRSVGIGKGLLRQLLAEAARDRKPVRLQVERHNPAQRLYRRLGFRQVADSGVYLKMEWSFDWADGAAS